jgi:hypothetical protein
MSREWCFMQPFEYSFHPIFNETIQKHSMIQFLETTDTLNHLQIRSLSTMTMMFEAFPNQVIGLANSLKTLVIF